MRVHILSVLCSMLLGVANAWAQAIDFHVAYENKDRRCRMNTKSYNLPIVTKEYYLQISHPFNARHLGLAPMTWTALADIGQTEFKRLEAKYLKLYAD